MRLRISKYDHNSWYHTVIVIGVASLVLLAVYLYLDHGSKARLEKRIEENKLDIYALTKQIPTTTQYIDLVKQLSETAGDKLTAYEITEIARIIMVQCALNQDIGLTPSIILGLIERESAFDPDAISKAKAYGLTQVIRPTFELHSYKLGYGEFNKDLALDPIVNVQVGIRHLVYLRKYWLSEGVNSWMITINSYFWGTTITWELFIEKKRARLPSLEYGLGVLKLAEEWKKRGVL